MVIDLLVEAGAVDTTKSIQPELDTVSNAPDSLSWMLTSIYDARMMWVIMFGAACHANQVSAGQDERTDIDPHSEL